MDQERRDAQVAALEAQCEVQRLHHEEHARALQDHTTQIIEVRSSLEALTARLTAAEMAHHTYDMMLDRLNTRADTQDRRFKHIEQMIQRTNELVTNLNSVFTEHSLVSLAKIIEQSARIEKLIRLVITLIGLLAAILVAIKAWQGVEDAVKWALSFAGGLM